MHQRDWNAKDLAPYSKADNVHFFGHQGLLRLSCSSRRRWRLHIAVLLRRGRLALLGAEPAAHRGLPCFPAQNGPWLPAWSVTFSTSAPLTLPALSNLRRNAAPVRAFFPWRGLLLALPRLALPRMNRSEEHTSELQSLAY